MSASRNATSRDPAGQSADFVQLLREFLAGYTAFIELFTRYGIHDIPFAKLRELVGDDEGAVLFRMKEKSHSLFRTDEFASEVVRHEALFDLALGSLFHEAMKLRESLYQRDVYGPRVALLREAADEAVRGTDRRVRPHPRQERGAPGRGRGRGSRAALPDAGSAAPAPARTSG